jgi:hypothetical protein
MVRAKSWILALAGGIAAAAALSGCGALEDLTQGVIVRGEPFIISGTSGVYEYEGGICRVWYADNGASYHLFQGARVTNDEFDRVTTPGVRSRLEIAPRNDLYLKCARGQLVEVQLVLEIVN